MKKFTKEMVTFTIEALPETDSISNALSFKETGADHSEYINKVIQDDGMNPWLWCCVKVRATFRGLEGTAYLGQCAYQSESDFKKGGYYEQMQDEAFCEVLALVSSILEALEVPKLSKLDAIQALINGEFDHPALMEYGALETNALDTIRRILSTTP